MDSGGWLEWSFLWQSGDSRLLEKKVLLESDPGSSYAFSSRWFLSQEFQTWAVGHGNWARHPPLKPEDFAKGLQFQSTFPHLYTRMVKEDIFQSTF